MDKKNREKLRRMWPVFVLGAIFNAYCLMTLKRTKARRLPKWAWAGIIMISTPGGGLTYLLLGRDRQDELEPEREPEPMSAY